MFNILRRTSTTSAPALTALVATALTATANAQTPSVTAPTQSIGAFITPFDAAVSSAQGSRTARKLIDGSGWGESAPGSGVYVHRANVGEGGGSMWNGAPDAWLQFDLGRVANVNGFYVWNYNESGGWNTRSVRDLDVLASADNKTFAPIGAFTLQAASGADGDRGQAVPFARPVRARYFKFQIRSNYRGGEMSGLAEVRFADAERKSAPPSVWKPKYPRPQHPACGPASV